MPSSGDSARWGALPEDEGLAATATTRSGAIGSLSAARGAADSSAGAGTSAVQPSADGTSLSLTLPGLPVLTIAHDPTAGLAHRVWPSSVVLAERALTEEGSNDLWALELGCGPGLAGAAWAAAGARVVLTDLEPCLPLAARSLELSGLADRATVARLGWGEPGAVETATAAARAAGWGTSRPVPDLLLAADVVYNPMLFTPLLDTLAQFGTAGTRRVLLAHVRRWKSDRRFWAAARREWEVKDVTEGEEGGGEPDARRSSSHERGAQRLFELTWKGRGVQL